MSENDESNAEPPSPAAAAAKQDKVKDEAAGADLADSVIASCVPESSSQAATPVKGVTCSSPPTPLTPGQEPPSTPTPPTFVSAPPSTPDKVVKPGVLRFGVVSEENVFVANKGVMPAVSTLRALSVAVPSPGQGAAAVAAPPAGAVQAAAASQPAAPPQAPGVPPVVSFSFPLQLPQQPPPGHMAPGQLLQLNQMSPPAGPAGPAVTPVPLAAAGAVTSAPATQGAPGVPGPGVPGPGVPGPGVPGPGVAPQHGVHVMHSLPQANQGPTGTTINKIPQFKVKPTSALMPDDKSKERSSKSSSHKKKIRNSPAGSPHSNPQPDQPFGLDSSGREDVQSPAYSDISDETAPVLESEMADKSKANSVDKKTEASQGPPHSLPPYFGIFPPFCAQSQPPYLVPSVQADGKTKEGVDKGDPKSVSDKDKKDGPPAPGEYSQKLLQQHYYPYGYPYPYNLEPYVAVIPMEEKSKDDRSPGPADQKAVGPQPSPIQVPNPNKLKTEAGIAKHQNENHQILKESIEMKNQMSSFIFSRQQPCQPGQPPPGAGQGPPQGPAGPAGPPGLPGQPGQPPPSSHPGPPGPMPPNQSQDEVRRYYLYADQRGLKPGPPAGPPVGGPGGPPGPPPGAAAPASGATTGPSPITGAGGGPGPGEPPGPPPKATPPPIPSKQNLTSPSPKHKDKSADDKSKEDKVKQEGVKPTMETQGPPPPPTSLFSYVHHPNYLQGPPYGGLPFAPDPGHPMYRPINSLLVPPSAYGNNPYLQLHSPLQRYHAPEDLSRPTASGPKALDILQHHSNQFYSSHKIHELQERALKSPTPKTVSASASPSGMAVGPPPGGPAGGPGAPPGAPPPTSTAGGPVGAMPLGKPSPAEGKDSRSPPPQRHVHTHHHTHVGLGYPILASQYSSPYGGKPVS